MPRASLTASLALDPDTDDLRPVAQLMGDLTGRRPSPATIWRWCRRGTSRAGRLPGLTVYGQWHTTREALVDWLRRGSELPTPPTDDAGGERPEATRRRLEDGR